MMETEKDPTKLPVQFNIQIPWDFKQFLIRKSRSEGVSLAHLGQEALRRSYGREFIRDTQGAGTE